MSDAVSPGRAVALRVIQRVGEGAYADRAFTAEARRARLDSRERSFAMQLAYGTVQRSRTLDWMIDQVVDRPKGLEGSVREVLRLGAYQLAFLDGVAAPAAVDQSVRQVRGLRGSNARRSARAGLVNAALRSLSGEAGALRRDLAEEPAGIRHSLPDWIVLGLESSLGAEAEGVMAALNEPAESAIRWNSLRGDRESLEAALPNGSWRRDDLIPEAYVLDAPFAIEDSQIWQEGRAMAQSRASMLAARILAPEPGERVLDLCAAPGAKSTHLAALSDGRAEIVAVELHASRAEALRQLAERMGARIEVIEGDGREVELTGAFDAVLVDPPCTGLGVLAARPDARWKRREEALGPLVELQSKLLTRALEVVRPGGRVVYSTCTLLSAENEDVVAATGAAVEDLSGDYPAFARGRGGALVTLPGRDGTDGFYVARLRT